MRGGDPVRRSQHVADAHRDRLLTLALVQRSRDLALQIQEIDALLEATDQLHAAIEVELVFCVDLVRNMGGAQVCSPDAGAHSAPTFKETTERPLPPYCLISDRTLAVIRACSDMHHIGVLVGSQ